MIDTNELRRLAQAATPGPWLLLRVGDKSKCFAVADINFLSVLTVADECGTSFGAVYLDGDAKFIAAANPAATTELLDRLEAAEKDIALKERIIDSLGSELNAVANERDALQAKVEAMERQKPVASVWRCDNGHIHGSCERTLPMGAKLYALPGAKGE